MSIQLNIIEKRYEAIFFLTSGSINGKTNIYIFTSLSIIIKQYDIENK